MRKITKSCCILSMCTFLSSQIVLAQESLVLNGTDEAYQQTATPILLGNYQNNTIFVVGKNVSNLRGGQLLSSNKQIRSMAVSPVGTTFAVVREQEKCVDIYDLWSKSKKIGTAKLNDVVTACCYSSDGVRLAIADEKGQISFFRLSDFSLIDATSLSFVANKLVVSDDGKLLAASNGTNVVVIGMDDKVQRAELSVSSKLSAMKFSPDSKELALLAYNGQMKVFDTRTFNQKWDIQSLGEGRDCDFHPNGKYIAVVTGNSRISLVNVVDDADRMYVDTDEGGVNDLLFAKDNRGGLYLVYNTSNAVHYKQMNELPPYLTKLLDDEVQARMAEWEKRMPDETDEEYQLRVNDETRAAQMRMLEEEIATRMAGDYGTDSQMTLGNYNPETNMMALDFEDMPPIYIDVPKEDLRYFMNADDIEIRNPIYGVGKNDKFELLYADIYNKQTGKTYVFDNRERKSLDYLAEENGFLPLEYAQAGAMDEMKLDELKETEMLAAKQDKKLSDHTKINVGTNTFNEVDKDGQRHLNYKVSFNYTVDDKFSSREDFAPGRYKTNESAAAQTMLSIMDKAMQSDFSKYIKEGKTVKVVVTGSADGSPIKRPLTYSGEYGDYDNAPVNFKGETLALTVNKKTGIATNEQLAFMRSMGMKDSIKKKISVLQKMDCLFESQIEQAEEIGGKYRRIYVDFIFVDAF